MPSQSIYSLLHTLTPHLTPHLTLLTLTAALTPLILYPFTPPISGPILTNISARSQLTFHLFATIFTLYLGHHENYYSPFHPQTYLAITLSLFTYNLTTPLTLTPLTRPTPANLKPTTTHAIFHLTSLFLLTIWQQQSQAIWLLTISSTFLVLYLTRPNGATTLLNNMIHTYTTLPMSTPTNPAVGYPAAILTFLLSQTFFVTQVLCLLATWWGDSDPSQLFPWLHLGFWAVLPVITMPLSDYLRRLEDAYLRGVTI
ncbi:hypothetical protein QBC40DRAFT_333312 [Triangularia verruculosa]|uniref:Uncharacterized protein n=1 Tax=Triangularia verruculosa TaxID=2587418 RepID=A0AAN6XFE9_9PEZI|nr:hypothetical protein QBC40DRAFT_333312 [Triangularia verruculosa]